MRRLGAALLAITAILCLPSPARAQESAAEMHDTVEAATIRIEPELALAAPQPIQVGIALSKTPTFAYYISTGFFMYPFTQSTKSLLLYQFGAGVRFAPQDGPFYVAGELGFQNIQVSTDISSFKIEDEAIASNAVILLRSIYLAPSVGYRFALSRRITGSVELGAHIPVMPAGRMIIEDSASGRNSDNSAVLKVDSDTAFSRVAAIVLPKITLLRLTWRLGPLSEGDAP